MEQEHGPSKSKVSGTGGKKGKAGDKKLSMSGGPFTATKLAAKEVRKMNRGRGSTRKVKLKSAVFANIVTKDGIKKIKLKNVIETPDNRHHARQNILTKGAIVESEIGKIRVTNRVGQDGVVNGVLLS
jgi:small subunit ribosomal protein S8e